MQLPQILVKSLENVPGFDEAAFRAVHESGEQVTSIRMNPAKMDAGPLDAGDNPLLPVPWCPYGFYLPQRPSFTLDPVFHAGAYYVQEASSMFLWHVLIEACDAAAGQVVLDLCAAPGGKSTLLSSFFRNGLVVSNEVIRSRANILVENITKWGDANVIVTNNDSRDFVRLPGCFDVIVADAPCSGSGLFRKDPGAIDEWSPANVNLCAQRQQRILADIIPALKENGILVYSTCSYSRQENEDILDWLTSEFQLESVTVSLRPEWNIVESTSPLNGAAGYRFFPDKVKGEGFFIAAFRQRAAAGWSGEKTGAISLASAKERAELAPFVDIEDDQAVFKQGDSLNIFPSAFLPQLRLIAGQLYIRQAGIQLGSFKGRSFVPAHALAVSGVRHHFPRVELDKEQALAYLRRQEIKPTAPQGWCLLTYRGQGLGWIKNLPNRTNNYYPQEWRILKS